MTLEIHIDSNDFVNHITNFDDQMKEAYKGLVPLMREWQVEDMNRKYPNTRSLENGAITSVWPRSRKSGNRGPDRSRRPIIREELVQKLEERLINYAEEVARKMIEGEGKR